MSQQQGGKAYKRSWKNLLINKRYQLRFTLIMVGLSTLLMVALGFWVMQVANEATKVSMAGVMGQCPSSPELVEETAPQAAPPAADDPAIAPKDLTTAPGSGSGSAAGSAAAAGSADGDAGSDEERPRAKVQLEDSTMEVVAPPPKVIRVPTNFGDQVVERWTCKMSEQNKLAELEGRRTQILLVLIGTGLLLAIGLGIYGIKMTHKVAGPLFKVGLYLAKMRDGRYDKVYSLRKGDQLVNFYEHFKQAHAGIVQMEQDDIAKLKSVVAAAESAGAGDHPAVAELREMIARKEKSVE